MKKSRVENTSKRGQKIAREAAARAYKHPENCYNDIFQVYKSPSIYKIRAFERCKALCHKMRGKNLLISSASCQAFSVVFEYVDKATGAMCFAYITKDYDRFCYQ